MLLYLGESVLNKIAIIYKIVTNIASTLVKRQLASNYMISYLLDSYK